MAKWYSFSNKDKDFTTTKITCTKKYPCKDKWTDIPIEMSRECKSCVWAEVELLSDRDRLIKTIKKPNPPMTYSEFMEWSYKQHEKKSRK